MTVIAGVSIFRYDKKECPENHLYHYTSLDALYSILKNRELWLGNTAAMNDKSEIKEFYSKLKAQLIKNYPNKEDSIKKLFLDVTKKIDGKYPFAMSLSTWEDDAAQWERYADNGSGVCIKFDIPQLAKLLVDLPMAIGKVYYGVDISEICNNDLKMLSECFEISEDELDQDNIDSVESSLTNLINFAAKYKNKGFASECEYRIYTYKGMASNTDIDKLMQYDNSFISSVSIDFTSAGHQIKKVLKVKLDKLRPQVSLDDIIEKIIIGPRSKQSVPLLKEFVRSLGYSKIEKHIESSKCTLV